MHGSSNADIGGVVSLPERPNHTTRMVRPRGVLEIMHYCLITRVHTTTHLSRHHATAPRTSWRFGGSSSCLDESSHPWVPGRTFHSTRAPHTEEGCGWLSSTHRHKESKPSQWTSTISYVTKVMISCHKFSKVLGCFPRFYLFFFFFTFFFKKKIKIFKLFKLFSKTFFLLDIFFHFFFFFSLFVFFSLFFLLKKHFFRFFLCFCFFFFRFVFFSVFFLCFFFLIFVFFLNKINILVFLTLAMVKGGSTRDAFTQKVALSGHPQMGHF